MCVSPCYSPTPSVSPSGQSSLGLGGMCPHAGTVILQNSLFEPFQGPVNLWGVGQEDGEAESRRPWTDPSHPGAAEEPGEQSTAQHVRCPDLPLGPGHLLSSLSSPLVLEINTRHQEKDL